MKKALSTSLLCFALSFAAVPAFAQSCTAVQKPDSVEKSLAVTATSLAVEVDTDNDRSAITLGNVRNNSATCFRDIMVEVKYFNARGENIDTYTQTITRFYSPPGSDIGFRVWDRALRGRDAYASQTLRVVSARPVVLEKDEAAQPARPLWVTLLLSWLPMLILIGVLVLYIWWFTRKGSIQQRQLAALEAQCRLLERQVTAVEALAQRTPQP
jgi:ATP-dependent Zn protease